MSDRMSENTTHLENAFVKENMATLLTIIRHREALRDQIEEFIHELRKRASRHDRTKLEISQFKGFVEIQHIARSHAYGTKEYKDGLKKGKEPGGPIDRHYRAERHHPEHFRSPTDMGFIDIIEMVFDWYAASATYETDSSFLHSMSTMRDHRKEQFSPEQWWLVEQVTDWILSELKKKKGVDDHFAR